MDKRYMMEYMPCWLDRGVAVFLDNRIKTEAALGRYVN